MQYEALAPQGSRNGIDFPSGNSSIPDRKDSMAALGIPADVIAEVTGYHLHQPC
jgi:hypothetical protein